MKFYNLYFSPTGGTKKVSDLLTEYIMGQWAEEKAVERIDMDLFTAVAEEGKLPDLQKEDLCLISVPAFAGRVPVPATSLLKEWKGNGAKAILNVVYGNRAIDDTLIELRDILDGAGFCCMAAMETVAEHSIFRQFGAGRPDEQDCRDLEAMAEVVAGVLEQESAPGVLQVPGNKPYKELKKGSMIPEGQENCTKCGVCATECPVQAIPKDAPEQVDRQLCFACMHCTSVCPMGARAVPEELLSSFLPHMEQVCAGRKENHLYIDRI